MSANNQVIIRKVNETLFEGWDVDVDSYEGNIEDAAWGGQPKFTAVTLEEAIQKYHAYCRELAEVGMSVEYGCEFEGV